jgi:hypothetical protein
MDQTTLAERQVVATRRFRSASGSDVIVTVYQPHLIQSEQWKCGFTILGLPEALEDSSYGVDSLQAVEMAFQGIRVHLERSGETLTWLDGEPGYLGIARIIPDSHGTRIERHLTKLVEEELARLLEEDAKSKGRPWPPKGS